MNLPFISYQVCWQTTFDWLEQAALVLILLGMGVILLWHPLCAVKEMFADMEWA